MVDERTGVAKIRINGEAFDFDGTLAPLSEALEIEKTLNVRYAQWEEDLTAGSMRAMAAFVWKVWHRDGRDIPLADIVDGKVEVELSELLESLVEVARERAELEAQAEAPKAADGVTGTDPDGTPTTGTGTPASSRKGSASGRGRSASST
jgi:hypothetical protein